MGELKRAPRVSWLRRLPVETPDALTRERAANRTRAYIYGNILILAALAALGTSAVESGHAVVVVLGTGLSTLVAHLVADIFSHQIRAESIDGTRPGLAADIRDALPIASSASIPALLMGVGWLGWISPTAAIVASIVVIVVRFFMLGSVAGYLAGRHSSWVSVFAGMSLAVVAVIVAVLKLILTH